jgi:Leucine-rich repeat (LRR) protein
LICLLGAGIECSGNCIVTISLPDNNLTSSLPSSIGNLGFLKEINLEGNNLTGTIPASFSELETLEIIRLGSNRFIGNIPDLSKMRNLVTIDFHTNAFTGNLPSWPFHSFLKPNWINFADNAITGCLPASLQSSNMSKVNIKNNYFQCSLPGWNNIIGQVKECSCDSDLGCTV